MRQLMKDPVRPKANEDCINANDDEQEVAPPEMAEGNPEDVSEEAARMKAANASAEEETRGTVFKRSEDDGVRIARCPKQPTQKEQEEHETTHCPPQPWCDHCVTGQAKNEAHHAVTGKWGESDITRVIMDYCFVQEDVEVKGAEDEEAMIARMVITILVMCETMCHSLWAYAVQSKGATEEWVKDQILEDLETVGVSDERIIVKSDQEASMTDMQQAIATARGKLGTALENSKVGESDTNGKVERAIQDLKGLVRTLRSAIEEKTGEPIHVNDPIVPWLVRHAANIINTCRVREDGKTAVQLMKGRKMNAKLLPLGEVVLFKIPKTQNPPGDFENRWERGVWVGFIIRTGEHLVATERGVFRVSTVMRRMADKRWSAELLKQIGGSPEDPVPGSKNRRIPAYAKKYAVGGPERAVYVPHRDPEAEPRVAYIYKKDVEEHGPTPRCPGCKVALNGGKYRAKHTDECRKRFEETLSKSEAGRKRYEAATERIMRRQDEQGEDGEDKKEASKDKEENTEDKNEDGNAEDPKEEAIAKKKRSVAQSATASSSSGSGMTEADRKKSVDEQNKKELKKAIAESKDRRPDVGMDPRGSASEDPRDSTMQSEDTRRSKKRQGEEPNDEHRFADKPRFPKEDRGVKRQAGEEADDADRFGDKKFRDDQDQTMGALSEHPGPRDSSEKCPAAEMAWQDIGSGVFAKTFKNVTRLPTTSKGGPRIEEVHKRVIRSVKTGKVVDECIVDDTADAIIHRMLPREEDLRVELTMKGALKMFERKGTDVAEIYSQPRIAQEAALREYDGVKLIPGWSLDLTTEDPKTGEAWDLSKKEVQKRVKKLIKDTEPFVVIGSPPCTMFSTLQELSRSRRNAKKYEKAMDEAREHIRFCIEVYKMQLKANRYFMHEHPEHATSWGMPEMIELMMQPGVERTSCDMCAYGMTAVDKQGEALAKKGTTVVSNSSEILKRVSKRCSNSGAARDADKHRHADLCNGGAKQCQVYPKKFCRAVCAGVAAQKKLHRLGMTSQRIMSAEEMLNAMGEHNETGDPSRDLHEEPSDETWIAFDDQSGAPLDPEKVRQARKDEIVYFKDMNVYKKVSIEECWAETGKAPIAVRWVDINKGDEGNPNYRSRLVAKEFKTDVKPELYAATPPSECLRLMLNQLTNDRRKKLMYADVSRAYFYARAKRPVYVKLPDEDKEEGDEMKCGRLVMSMYGTRDAATNWASEYTETLIRDGFVQGKANPCLFHNPRTDVSVMVHGDDFVAVGYEKTLKEARSALENKYKIKVETLGDGLECAREVRILNKVVRYTDAGVELEADPRHAEIVVKELGLENAKAVRVPGAKEARSRSKDKGQEEDDEIMLLDEEDGQETVLSTDVPEEDGQDSNEDEEDRDLGPDEASRYRALAARLNYLAPDRIDIQYAVKEAARAMSSPKKRHWRMLTKIGRYLVGRPRMIMKFPWQVKQEMVTAYTDSDWAGCSKTSKSTSGGIIMIGDHVIKSYSKQQKVIALSSAEAELYAMVAASAEALAVIAFARDLGMKMEGDVYTDSSAALGIAQRKGIGKVRHLRTQGLWVQETRATGRLKYNKVLGTKNPSDILTKHVQGDLLDRHLGTIGASIEGGRAESAPELNTVESFVSVLDGPEDWIRKEVRFSSKVTMRSIPWGNKGRKCEEDEKTKKACDRGGEESTKVPQKERWADMADGNLEFQVALKDP